MSQPDHDGMNTKGRMMDGKEPEGAILVATQLAVDQVAQPAFAHFCGELLAKLLSPGHARTDSNGRTPAEPWREAEQVIVRHHFDQRSTELISEAARPVH